MLYCIQVFPGSFCVMKPTAQPAAQQAAVDNITEVKLVCFD
jgi:hypothetical protein